MGREGQEGEGREGKRKGVGEEEGTSTEGKRREGKGLFLKRTPLPKSWIRPRTDRHLCNM